MTTRTQEEDIRIKILNSFLTCPHRNTGGELKLIHEELREKDPLFYAHLAAWYKKNGDIRDHNEVFSAMLMTDPFIDNRDVGVALFQQHHIFMKSKILGFLKGKHVTLREKTGKKIRKGKNTIDEVKNRKIKVGLEKNVPSRLKTEIIAFLRWLEKDNDRFDSVAMGNVNDLKMLYAAKGIQIKPSPRAQQILFDLNFPEDSKFSIFKRIRDAKTPEEAAHLMVEHKVPYTIAISLREKITPSILIALINNMSSQEIITNMASLEEKGVMENEGTKALVLSKLQKAKTAKNVTALKSKRATQTGRIKNETVIKQLDEIADKQIKKSGVIKNSTAIFVDRSGSMHDAITVGKQVASLVSGATEADLHVVAFDTMAQAIKANGNTLTAWEKAFAPIRSGGGTSIGCALEFLIRYNLSVEQIVVITDEDERNQPRFVDVFKRYVEKTGITPNIIIIRIGHIVPRFSRDLDENSISYDVYTPKGNDYYSLPGLLQMLSKNSKLDLVYEIMDFPLPKRKVYA